jgi:hypothetical protein
MQVKDRREGREEERRILDYWHVETPGSWLVGWLVFSVTDYYTAIRSLCSARERGVESCRCQGM